MTDPGCILVINAGSSSVKFTLFEADLRRRLDGALTGIGTAPHLHAKDGGGDTIIAADWGAAADAVDALIARLMAWLEAQMGGARLAAIGHRVAFGGSEHDAPERVTPAVLDRLRALVPFAPLHQPRNLEPIDILGASHPGLTQIACFDTGFHATLPRLARLYGLPRALTDAGARRYGFHGLSFEYIAGRLAELDPAAAAGRTIVAHLGSGASLCALAGGRSIATTMGFSPLSGLMMGTRPGELDAGLVLWLLRERGMVAAEIEQMLYQDSGLKGVSGISGDMRALLASPNPAAAEAMALFVHRLVMEIGALVAALGGLDALVFTAGIGENAPTIRAATCERLAWLGVCIEPAANDAGQMRISPDSAAVRAWVIPTDEALAVARHCARLLRLLPEPVKGP